MTRDTPRFTVRRRTTNCEIASDTILSCGTLQQFFKRTVARPAVAIIQECLDFFACFIHCAAIIVRHGIDATVAAFKFAFRQLSKDAIEEIGRFGFTTWIAFHGIARSSRILVASQLTREQGSNADRAITARITSVNRRCYALACTRRIGSTDAKRAIRIDARRRLFQGTLACRDGDRRVHRIITVAAQGAIVICFHLASARCFGASTSMPGQL
mmetsp:Transcript_11506/g.22027  ORF Transcript_11506/g.22027 Transcript_11506/m.22027 type:complete len:214 (-) Transcript_11506:284-925(-)